MFSQEAAAHDLLELIFAGTVEQGSATELVKCALIVADSSGWAAEPTLNGRVNSRCVATVAGRAECRASTAAARPARIRQ